MKIRSLICGALLASAPAFALDLKGVQIGKRASVAQLRAAFGTDCHGADGSTMIEGVRVRISLLCDKADVLLVIRGHFGPDFYPQLEQAARAKYGAPAASETVPQQNGFGARFINHDVTWFDAEGARVWLIQNISMTEGLLLIESAGQRAKENAREAAERAKSKM